MIELAVTIIIIVYTLYRIYCFAMRQSAKEEEFWANRRIFYNDLFTRIYAIAKIALLIFVIACAILLFTTLAYGETPSLRDFKNPKFLELLLGASILAFPQCGFIWLYRGFPIPKSVSIWNPVHRPIGESSPILFPIRETEAFPRIF